MNKSRPIFFSAALSLFFSTQLFASETVIVLRAYNSRGLVLANMEAIATKDFLMINSEKLSSQQVIALAPEIKNIATFKTTLVLKTCEAGRFEHILKKGKLVKKESGCLESERFKELEKSFKALKKDIFLKDK